MYLEVTMRDIYDNFVPTAETLKSQKYKFEFGLGSTFSVGDCRAKPNTPSTLICTIRPLKSASQLFNGFSTLVPTDKFKSFPLTVNVLPSLFAKLDSTKPSQVRMKRLSST